MLTKIRQAWLAPIAPERLGMIRILVGLFSLWYLLGRYDMMLDIADSSPAMYDPVGLALLFSTPFPVGVFKLLLNVTILLNIGFILGWKYRFTGPLFALSFLLLMCYRNSWSMLYHNYNTLVLHVCVLGFSVAAGALSLDSRNGKMAHLLAWHYGWPVRLLSVLTVITYFLSGVAKLYGDLAWDWVSGAAMRSQVAVDGIRKEVLAEGVQPFFEWLYPHTEIFLIMGIVAMVVELGAPLALANRKLGIAWCVLAFSMHWGIFFVMGIKFPYHYSGFIYLSFLPLEYLYRSVKGNFNKPSLANSSAEDAKPLILFDGVCNLCNRSVQYVIRHDPAAQFQFAALQSAQGQALLAQYGAPTDLSSIVLLQDGKFYTASTAALKIAQSLRFPLPLLGLGWVLPRIWRDALYHYVARNRYRWFGRTDEQECWLPSPELKARFVG